METADALDLSQENLWIAVYRDRMRGGVGYELVMAPPSPGGRPIVHEDPSTLLALSLAELIALRQGLETAPALRAPGALAWLPIGLGKHVVWGDKAGAPSAQLVVARSAEDAAELVRSKGQTVSATTDLSQVDSIIVEMQDVLDNKRYDKILSDIRPEANDTGNNWLALKKDPVLARMAALFDLLEAAEDRGEKAPDAARELLELVYEGSTPPPVEDLLSLMPETSTPSSMEVLFASIQHHMSKE